jgi:methylenetetrahydrofolate reductase (NADPH)
MMLNPQSDQPQLVGSILRKPGTHLSFEFFPPKDLENLSKIYDVAAELKSLNPDFCSVTWGAGGSTIKNSLEVVKHLTHGMGILTVAHFTGLGITRDLADEFMERFIGSGINNLLVLRGDRPHAARETAFQGGAAAPTGALPRDSFKYAGDLLAYIRSKPHCGPDELSLLVAGCPEGHPEAESIEKDWDHLANKVRQGADGIVTQLFFDNGAFYRFKDGLKKRRVEVPISVGVMLVTRAKMIQKIIELSKCKVPAELNAAIERFVSDDASMEAFGIDYAARQVAELHDQGVRHFHFYTLNQSGPTAAVLKQLKGRLGERPTPAPRTVLIEYREYMAYPDSKLTDLFKKYGLDPNRPHDIVHNHALRRYEITQ